MAKPKALEFANFVLNFGKNKVLADLLDEVVIPAFTDTKQRREYGDTTYFLIDVQVLDLGTKKTPEPAIGGTFVKDTVLRREQIWNEKTGQIEQNPRKLPSSPSVTFVLLLANHKLLYLHETSQAPGIDAFRGTLQRFLTRKYMDFIDKEYTARRTAATEEERKKITKKSLKELYEPPTLGIIPLLGGDDLKQFVGQFKILSSIKVELTSVNAEADNDPLFKKIRTAKNAVGADKAILIETKKEGLNKSAVLDQLESVAREGNARVELGGLTERDAPLNVSSDEIRLRIPMTNMPPDLNGKAARALQEFTKAIEEKTIIVGKVDEEQAKAIRDKFRS